MEKTPRLGLPIYASWRDAPWDAERWPSFSPRELACRRTGKLAYDPDTLDKLQALRDRLMRPMIVTSGFRSREHNATLRGAAKNSWHLDGVAFDIDMRNHDPHHFIRCARDLGFTGIGTYPGSVFTHIDTRAHFGAAPATWGTPWPATAEAFSEPEPVPEPPATPGGRAGAAVAGGAGAVVVAREVAPTLEAARGLSEPVQIALLVGVGLVVLALIVWGPDGIRAALRRWRGGEDL